MEDGSASSFISILAAWFPMLLLIGAFIYFARSYRSRVPDNYWNEQLGIERDALEARRETNRLLAALVAKMEK